MASSKACTAALLLLLAVVVIAAATADAAKNLASSEPVPRLRPAEEDAAGKTCVSSLLALSPCLPFFKDAGTAAAPEGCCAGLRGIIDDQAVCLCHIVNHTLERAIGVDIPVDRAFTLLGDICGLAPPQAVLATCANEGQVPPLYACPAPSA